MEIKVNKHIAHLFPKAIKSVNQFHYYKIKALKHLGCMIGMWGKGTTNPYMAKKKPLESELILKLFWVLHLDDLPKYQFLAITILLDYYFPIWRHFATKEVIGLEIKRGDRKVALWRKAVLLRDGERCIECGATENIQAHHICEWAEYPELRIDIDNGISLCGNCHYKRHPKMGLKIFTKNLNNN